MIEKGYGVSVRGMSHIENKIPNQDCFISDNKDDYTLCVVCDGLGSKKYSHFASKRLCKLVKKMVKHQYKTNSLDPMEFMKNLQRKYIRHLFPFSLKNADSTLQIILLNKDMILAIKVGDGLIAIKDNDLHLLDEDDDNFSNETVSFGKSQPNDWKIKIYKKDASSKIIVCTDGIAGDLKIDSLDEFIEEICKCDTEEIKDMLVNWPNPYSKDDKTIVVVK